MYTARDFDRLSCSNKNNSILKLLDIPSTRVKKPRRPRPSTYVLPPSRRRAYEIKQGEKRVQRASLRFSESFFAEWPAFDHRGKRLQFH